ncbi:MAG: gluconokinase [Cyclobacteriaceae bacterium]
MSISFSLLVQVDSAGIEKPEVLSNWKKCVLKSEYNKVVFVMGVSGAGKSTVGKLLAKEMSLPFFDGDDFHSKESVKKMTMGIPLTDDDRRNWLNDLNQLARREKQIGGCIIACSALKREYRNKLSEGIEQQTRWVYLNGTYDQIRERLKKRENHFMSEKLLKTQFDALEEPEQAIDIDIELAPNDIINIIKEKC